MKITISMFCVLLLLGGCVSTQEGPSDPRTNSYEEYIVEMKAQGGEIEITSAPQGDNSNGKKKGWVGFARGTYGTITFVLISDSGNTNTSCTADPATSAEWVITQLALSKFGDQSTEKGERFGYQQNGWIQKAFLGISKFGIVFDEDISIARTSAVLVNANNNSGPERVYYRLQAKRCDGEDPNGLPIETDPGIGNGGKR